MERGGILKGSQLWELKLALHQRLQAPFAMEA